MPFDSRGLAGIPWLAFDARGLAGIPWLAFDARGLAALSVFCLVLLLLLSSPFRPRSGALRMHKLRTPLVGAQAYQRFALVTPGV